MNIFHIHILITNVKLILITKTKEIEMKKKIIYALSALLVATVVSTQIPAQAATTTTTTTYPSKPMTSKPMASKPMTTKTVKKVVPAGEKGTTIKNTTETRTIKTNTTQKIPAGK